MRRVSLAGVAIVVFAAVVNAPKDQEQGLAKLSEAERAIWREAVSFYAKDLSKKDVVFDEPLCAA